MKTILFSVLLAFSATVQAQSVLPEICETSLDDKVIQLNENYFIKLRMISENEYTLKKQESSHLAHKPHKGIEDVTVVKRILGDRFIVRKGVSIESDGRSYEENLYEITFKDGEKKWFKEWAGLLFFDSYFPEVEVLFFVGGHEHPLPYDLNDSTKEPEHVGTPDYYNPSPDKQFRLNGYYHGQGFSVHFLERWDSSKKRYEFINNLGDDGPYGDFNNAGAWFWISNRKAIGKTYRSADDDDCDQKYYEIEILEKKR